MMKRLALLLAALLALATGTHAQSTQNFGAPFSIGVSVPSSCAVPSFFIRASTGHLYGCQSSVFVDISSGASGGSVVNNGVNTGTAAMTLDMSASTVANAFKVPVVAGGTASANGTVGPYDSTSNNLHTGNASADAVIPVTTVTPTNGNSVVWSVSSGKIKLGDSGSAPGGSPGGGIIGYSSSSLTLTAGTRYFPIVGGGAPSTTETDVDTEAPSTATITNLYASTGVSLGAGTTAAITIRDNTADTSITCTITAPSTSCSDTTHSFNTVAADLLTFKIVTTGTVTATPTLVITAQFGTTGSNGTVNSGTTPRLAYYAGTGTAVSDAGANLTWTSPALTIGVATSTTGLLKQTGATSGTVTITPQATAGTPTLTYPNASGTFAVSASAPLALSATTGNMTVTGAAGQVLGGSTPAFTATPSLGTDNSVAGTLQLANSAANAHTIWSSGATTSNTVAGFATAPTTGDLVDCTTASTTCTLHDSGLATSTVLTTTNTKTLTNKTLTGTTSGNSTGLLYQVAPQQVLAAASVVCAGACSGGTWGYKVVAVDAYSNVAGLSSQGTATNATTLTSTNKNTITVPASFSTFDANVATFSVYRTATAGTPANLSLVCSAVALGGTCVDDGSVNTATATPGRIVGTSAEAVVFSYTVLGNQIQAGKCARMTAVWQHTGSTSTAYNIRYGATTSGTGSSTTAGVNQSVIGYACNYPGSTAGQTIFTNFGGTSSTAAIDSTANQVFTWNFNVASTDSVDPKLFVVELVQ